MSAIFTLLLPDCPSIEIILRWVIEDTGTATVRLGAVVTTDLKRT